MTAEVLWTALGALAAIAAVAWGIITWVIAQFGNRDARITAAEKSLADHKLHAAETFATRAGLTDTTDRVLAAIDRLNQRIDELLRIERRKDES